MLIEEYEIILHVTIQYEGNISYVLKS